MLFTSTNSYNSHRKPETNAISLRSEHTILAGASYVSSSSQLHSCSVLSSVLHFPDFPACPLLFGSYQGEMPEEERSHVLLCLCSLSLSTTQCQVPEATAIAVSLSSVSGFSGLTGAQTREEEGVTRKAEPQNAREMRTSREVLVREHQEGRWSERINMMWAEKQDH